MSTTKDSLLFAIEMDAILLLLSFYYFINNNNNIRRLELTDHSASQLLA